VSNAGTLASVSTGDGNDWLWRIGKTRATRLGAVPVPAGDVPILTPDGRTVLVVTPQGIQWWDATDPARPTRAGSSRLPLASN
jgi:hypothetical protein